MPADPPLTVAAPVVAWCQKRENELLPYKTFDDQHLGWEQLETFFRFGKDELQRLGWRVVRVEIREIDDAT